jgi:hypothetical protein
MKKVILTLLIVAGIGFVISSCSSKHCDAYNSTNHYRAEIIR